MVRILFHFVFLPSTMIFLLIQFIIGGWKALLIMNEWVQLSGNSLIRFTNLSPGKYKLYVRAISKEEPSIVFRRTASWNYHIATCMAKWLGYIHIYASDRLCFQHCFPDNDSEKSRKRYRMRKHISLLIQLMTSALRLR